MTATHELWGTGEQWGLRLSYAAQPQPEGLAQAFLIGRDFVGQDTVCLVLGDNVFHGNGLSELLQRAAGLQEGAVVFGYQVRDPERYGVLELDSSGRAVSIEEKPARPRSNIAVTGMYFFDNRVLEVAAGIRPSARGELEISDVIRDYLQRDQLRVEVLSRGFMWLDTGTLDSLVEASSFIEVIQKRQGLKVACPEEIAFRMGYITARQLADLAEPMCKNEYGQYLLRLAEGARGMG